MKNFWNELKRPFTALAPMEGVTDYVFRQIITKLGKPDVLFTEFTSVEGFQSKGRIKLEGNFFYGPLEKPIVAQIWGIDPNNFYKTAKYLKNKGFSGIDINMGCPIKTVLKTGSCGALISNKNLAKEIIDATREGCKGLPISVKTRIGLKSIEIDSWIGFLLEQNLSALSIHLRTVSELSKVPAHWEYMENILGLRNRISKNTVIVGNGDITSYPEIIKKYKVYKCDGFMAGRGILNNPWMFNAEKSKEDISVKERVNTYMDHISLFRRVWGDSKNFEVLKKFCKVYINSFADAKEYREQIVKSKSFDELYSTVSRIR